MAFEENISSVTLEAGQDLSSSQYYFVSVAADGQVDATGDGEQADGVLQNAPAAQGRAAEVAISGITKVVCGGTVTRGGNVASDANGKAVDAATNDIILGVALAAGTSGSTTSILLRNGGGASA